MQRPSNTDSDVDLPMGSLLARRPGPEFKRIREVDMFALTPPKDDDETLSTLWADKAVKWLKVLTYLLTFIMVLATAVVSKGSLLFMTSQLKVPHKAGIARKICKKQLYGVQEDKEYCFVQTDVERGAWFWMLYVVLVVPEILTFIRCFRICVFKSFKKPTLGQFLMIFLMETGFAIGVSLLVFVVLPEMDVFRGVMFLNCSAFIPALLNLLTYKAKAEYRTLRIIGNVLCIVAQAAGIVAWCRIKEYPVLQWSLPVSAFLISGVWWENYVDSETSIPGMKWLIRLKKDMKKCRFITYVIVSVWKMAVMLVCMLLMSYINMSDGTKLFSGFVESFSKHKVNFTQMVTEVTDKGLESTCDPKGPPFSSNNEVWVPIILAAIQLVSSFLCYRACVFACKICIQPFSFAFPISLASPVVMSLLVTTCALNTYDSKGCFFHGFLPRHLFYNCPAGHFFQNFVGEEHAWVWALWFLSQIWITSHIWTSDSERLAAIERLFINPMFSAALLDQSLTLNRRRVNEEPDGDDCTMVEEDPDNALYDFNMPIKLKQSDDHTIRIYVCATMWHENQEEMVQLFKSLMRMDEDQCARRITKDLCGDAPDYYEFEAHIFFDDAFMTDMSTGGRVVNEFVKLMVTTVDVAASSVHETEMALKPPTKIATPYGGRMEWTMPGDNKIIAHLKDKNLIRHRKRWSQVMYMYYLLGHKLMAMNLPIQSKMVRAENSFILALDGDINFRPQAVQLLIDLMKKNKNLGAACGRIHPVGSGPMVWYQKFEYAVGHWLQKSTEHMIGCVLCSPGCFSLFRAKAVMDDNVMKKYTTPPSEAIHYVQYDQGEDRWLCTLLLQRGYRVEYSAASDAYTHCPETFEEFFTQRRRWAPSTLANIMDLLLDYKNVVEINDNISMLYIGYQVMLMVGTILGPGTIFLMLVGSMVTAFNISTQYALLYNGIPIMIFILICFFANNKYQVLLAQILSTLYALLMMAVLVGTLLQIQEDGILSPSALFFISLSSSFIVSALMHPQEFACLVHGMLYFLLIPSMYLLLVLYSITNLHVVTWGTREVKRPEDMLKEEMMKKEAVAESSKLSKALGLIGLDKASGRFSSLNTLLSCVCCGSQKSEAEEQILLKITEKLNEIDVHIKDLKNEQMNLKNNLTSPSRPSSFGKFQMDDRDHGEAHSESGSVASQHTASDDRSSENNTSYWIEDKELPNGVIKEITAKERQFWHDLIQEYLLPLDENKEQKQQIQEKLIELRNKVVFAFFMFNSLFILIVFLLQINKDQLFIRWPLASGANITFIPQLNRINIEKKFLELEPIGLMFVVFFGLILVIQFIGMLLHRAETISHILAATELNFFASKKELDPKAAEEPSSVLPLVREYQKLATEDQRSKSKDRSKETLARRNTIYMIQSRSENPKEAVVSLREAFKRRLDKDSELPEDFDNDGPAPEDPKMLRRGTVHFMKQRKESVFSLSGGEGKGRKESNISSKALQRRNTQAFLKSKRGSLFGNLTDQSRTSRALNSIPDEHTDEEDTAYDNPGFSHNEELSSF